METFTNAIGCYVLMPLMLVFSGEASPIPEAGPKVRFVLQITVDGLLAESLSGRLW